MADASGQQGSPTPGQPLSTYRVQLTPNFGFDEAGALADYLGALGVTHLYASPYLQAAPGSTHGYDVVNYHRVNVELGGEAGHARMCADLRGGGLGHVLDIVPNHMAITGRENAWWWDVLENGPSSVYASYFDVDWDPPESKLRNMVLLPVLHDHYGRVLEAGELHLERQEGSFTISYRDHAVPVAPRSLDQLVAAAAERCGSDELESLATALSRLPPSTATDHTSVRERHRDKEILRARLAELCEHDREVARAVDAEVAEVNADVDAMDALLERQNYRLAYWRTAARELGYRRFFDITTLVGLRVEEPQVFEDTHERVLGWLRECALDGVRVDHPDGLQDPEAYLRRLAEASGGAWVVAEKILERNERLRPTWPVAGTTGYDFLNRVGGLFVDREGEHLLTRLYGEVTGMTDDFAHTAYQSKHLVMRETLTADVNRLTALFVQVCERHRRYRDYTRQELHEVLEEVLACFPVYRTYVRPGDGAVSEEDEAYVEEAVAKATEHRADLDPELFCFLRDLLLLRVEAPGSAGLPVPAHTVEAELAARFQQVSAPVMAKGVEDTAFYVYLRLASLNEVGGDPGWFGTSVEDFHQACGEAQRRWPCGMLTLSTHDTKRSEDVRARLNLLSEVPERWADAVRRWTTMNRRHRRGGKWPDRNAEYLLYQTLVGAWPLDSDRAVAYMEKASREAKAHTSWTHPDPEYDQALLSFVESVLSDDGFLKDLATFVRPLVGPGRITSLAQTLIKLTAPGVPDTYQGTELWDLSLVDPDNRRPVDYGVRRKLLEEVADLAPEDVLARDDDGLPKLLVTTRALQLRRRCPDLFGTGGDYEPVRATGPHAGRVVAFSRGGGAMTVVPRLVMGLSEGWDDTALDLPQGPWHNHFTSEEWEAGPVPLAALLGRFPVALLSSQGMGCEPGAAAS